MHMLILIIISEICDMGKFMNYWSIGVMSGMNCHVSKYIFGEGKNGH